MVKFGWCCTGHHEHCRYGYIDWNGKEYVCDCECHGGASPATNIEALKKEKAAKEKAERDAVVAAATEAGEDPPPVKKTRAPRKAKA